ncbi:MAG: hypothetical protein P9M05_08085 [Candidatus Stygibacter australis]|nr:hypothetical protein [Candidatus Stygibacter australis]
MYYSKILTDLKKQERKPVNKMYLSEIALKWKAFQQLTEEPSSGNKELAEALSKFLGSLHNRKFLFNKLRGTGFDEDSPLFSASYINDLISSLMSRQPIMSEPGIVWDFQSLNYRLALKGNNPVEITRSPVISSQKTPPVLSLTLNLDYQYRVSGKRNFTKEIFNLPFLLFFVIKNLTAVDLFNIEHYALQVKSTCHIAQTFIICETLEKCLECNYQEIPVKIFALHLESRKNRNQISVSMVNSLETAIKNVLYHSPEAHMVKEAEKAIIPTPQKEAPPRTNSRRSNYKKKK